MDLGSNEEPTEEPHEETHEKSTPEPSFVITSTEESIPEPSVITTTEAQQPPAEIHKPKPNPCLAYTGRWKSFCEKNAL